MTAIVIRVGGVPTKSFTPDQFVRVPCIGAQILDPTGLQHVVVKVVHAWSTEGPVLIVDVQ